MDRARDALERIARHHLPLRSRAAAYSIRLVRRSGVHRRIVRGRRQCVQHAIGADAGRERGGALGRHRRRLGWGQCGGGVEHVVGAGVRQRPVQRSGVDDGGAVDEVHRGCARLRPLSGCQGQWRATWMTRHVVCHTPACVVAVRGKFFSFFFSSSQEVSRLAPRASAGSTHGGGEIRGDVESKQDGFIRECGKSRFVNLRLSGKVRVYA